MHFHFALLLFTSSILYLVQVQHSPGPREYLIRSVAFYNLENLFDTLDDSLTYDGNRTPSGLDNWTDERLETKLENLSCVISALGAKFGANPPDLIGVCEVENRKLLERLIEEPSLRSYPYDFIHYDSPDPRGIDVALLYRSDRFFPTDHRSFRLLLFNYQGIRKYTRDQLVVSGYLDQELINILINHWPSRGSGSRSWEFRKAAALRQRALIDSIQYDSPNAKIIVMGDFNDNPTDPSLTVLMGKMSSSPDRFLHNPFAKFFRQGIGSHAYRDRWNLFDQMLFSNSLIDAAPNSYRLWKSGVFRPEFLKTQKGRYAGYPFRSYAGGRHQGGFSDHFPVYAYLIRPASPEAN